mgnify:FL=1
MIPPLSHLSLLSIDAGAKRKFEDQDEDDTPGYTVVAEAETTDAEPNEAQKLLKILHDLPGMSLERAADTDPEWVYALSNDQFDMLLAMRLYTGSLYKMMARALTNSEQMLDALHHANERNHSYLLYFAMCNAKRRFPSRMNGPFFVAGLKEDLHVMVGERLWRQCVARHLTDHRMIGSRLTGPDYSMATKVQNRVFGRGAYFDELARAPEYRDAWPGNMEDLAKKATSDFMFAVSHHARALSSFILDSKIVVVDEPIATFRGIKHEFSPNYASEAFVSVSLDEDTSRYFTTNKDLQGPDQCCMIRVSLLPGTPYLDVDATLEKSNGWGFSLGEEELLLPPGLDWNFSYGNYDEQPARFPDEIYETEIIDNPDNPFGFGREQAKYYDLSYYTVKPHTENVY